MSYKRWIQIFASMDIILSCFRLVRTIAISDQSPISFRTEFQDDDTDDFHHRQSYNFDNSKYVLLGVLYYILQVMTLSLAIFLMFALSEKNGMKQIQRIHMWSGGTFLVILIYIIYLIRRLYFVDHLSDRPIYEYTDHIWYFDIAEILFRFLFAVFVNKYISFVNPGNNNDSFSDIDPEIREAFHKFVFQSDEGMF